MVAHDDGALLKFLAQVDKFGALVSASEQMLKQFKPTLAVGLIIKGYAGDVLNKMPMEFAVEAQKLLQISLEGSVG